MWLTLNSQRGSSVGSQEGVEEGGGAAVVTKPLVSAKPDWCALEGGRLTFRSFLLAGPDSKWTVLRKLTCSARHYGRSPPRCALVTHKGVPWAVVLLHLKPRMPNIFWSQARRPLMSPACDVHLRIRPRS
jgi:hypothetical protein